MTGLITWCTERARMVVVLIALSVGAGLFAYVNLPKEGAPNIDIPVLYLSVPVPGISAVDAERLIVKPLETEMRGLDNLKEMTGIASDSHGALLIEFDFGWDKPAVLAEVRDKLDRVEAEFPSAAETSVIREINLSEFPILVVSLSGSVPERTLVRLAKDLQREIEANQSVLSANLTGHRDEMLEVVIDPLKLESYNVTAQELLTIIDRNNQLVAAGSVESASAAFSVKLPGAFEKASDVLNLPVKTNGDRVVRLSDVADVRRTFEDREGTARYNARPSISLQISKRIGENIIETVDAVRAIVAAETAKWPAPLAQAVRVDIAMDQSTEVNRMIGQLENSVMTAIILVMIVVLAALGFRSAILVGVAIPSSFLLSFALMSVAGLPINNMVMFGLILAVGMLVDGAIVVVEYADKQIAKGQGPMRAYAAAAKRMFWPIVASTATTLCAFLPMLFWPGMPGQFMGLLPVTLIFVLSASLVVALIFLPVLGGLSGRLTRTINRGLASVLPPRKPKPQPPAGYRRTVFGRFVALAVANPIGPFVAIGLSVFALYGIMTYYGENQNGVEFFVKTEPERAIVYVRARGNLSLAERDRMVAQVESRVIAIDGVTSVFAFAGEGGLETGGGGDGPSDAIGQVQIELAPWGTRRAGDDILAEITEKVAGLPGVIVELALQKEGPQQGKPVQLEIRSPVWDDLLAAATTARARMDKMPHLANVDDTRPLPGIDWEIVVDRAVAARFGADVATVGPLVQLVTRGALLGTYRPDDYDDELDIRMRFPDEDRRLSTLDQLKVPGPGDPVPMAHFIDIKPVPRLEQVNRRESERFFLIRADMAADAPSDVSEVTVIDELETWIAEDRPFPPSVTAQFTGDREEQAKSQAFLMQAFIGALGLMFLILLAQFNSIYNSVLVLSAVVMSVAGVLIGMLVMGQKFSIIMTGTGIVALAGIVVNNNIVLIDTYQEFARRMGPLEAIIRTAEARIRPVLLTTITTMAGLAPMMMATSLDFATGTMQVGAPTALWWVQLATAVVWGLGLATVLTLVVTPAALAARIWVLRGALWLWRQRSKAARVEGVSLAKEGAVEIIFVDPDQRGPAPFVRAAE